MSVEQLPEDSSHQVTYAEYADQTWHDELVRMQNEGAWPPDRPLLLSGSFQKLYAESLIRTLKDKQYFQKFGGKTLEIIMIPTTEPYMYNLGLRITD